jgi:hypothetical protein
LKVFRETVAARRALWLDRNWKVSEKGNSYLKTDGFIITIFGESPKWKAWIADSKTGNKRFSSRSFATEERAKLAPLMP